jgi:hypothetical protein
MEERMRISRQLAGVVASIALALTMAGAAPAQAAVASSVTIRWNSTDHYFHGQVTAGHQECVAHRTVKVFKKTASGPQLVGKDTSNQNGNWRVTVMAHSGKYFAKTPAKTIMSTDCAKARSKTIDVM